MDTEAPLDALEPIPTGVRSSASIASSTAEVIEPGPEEAPCTEKVSDVVAPPPGSDTNEGDPTPVSTPTRRRRAEVMRAVPAPSCLTVTVARKVCPTLAVWREAEIAVMASEAALEGRTMAAVKICSIAFPWRSVQDGKTLLPIESMPL